MKPCVNIMDERDGHADDGHPHETYFGNVDLSKVVLCKVMPLD